MKFELADSHLIRGLLLLAHGLAALMVAVASLPLPIKAVLGGLLIASAVYYLRKSHARTYVEIAQDYSCLLQFDAARAVECRLLPRSFVASYLVVLHLHSATGIEYIIITPDRLDPDTFRRLRVFLRWGLRLTQRQDVVGYPLSSIQIRDQTAFYSRDRILD